MSTGTHALVTTKSRTFRKVIKRKVDGYTKLGLEVCLSFQQQLPDAWILAVNRLCEHYPTFTPARALDYLVRAFTVHMCVAALCTLYMSHLSALRALQKQYQQTKKKTKPFRRAADAVTELVSIKKFKGRFIDGPSFAEMRGQPVARAVQGDPDTSDDEVEELANDVAMDVEMVGQEEMAPSPNKVNIRASDEGNNLSRSHPRARHTHTHTPRTHRSARRSPSFH